MGVIIFNGISSKDFLIEVEHFPGYETPQRDYEVVHVPGKNGDVFIDKGSYQNVSRTYEIAIGSYVRDYTDMANSVSEWLHSASGYARLEDSYEPEYYRLAIYEETLELTNIFNQAGRATISFNCKPQRFLKLGEKPVKITKNDVAASSGISLRNPTRFTALPIVTVKGSGAGVLRIGDYSVSISSIGTTIVIDSEIQDAYYQTENKNSVVTLSKGFPKLGPGHTEVSFSGGITEVEVIPKWWTL